MSKRQEKLVKKFEEGSFKVAIFAQMVGDKIIKFIVYVWRGAKLLFKKAYPTMHKAMVAFDNWTERAIKDVSGRTVDVPIVKG